MGRVTYGNTIKYIKMVASSNFGNVFSILIASAWLPFEPMTSLQLLIQNLLYDISQIAIPWDRMDEEYLQEPKKWDAIDLLRFIIVLGPTSSTIDVLTFCLGWFYYNIRTADDPEAVKLFRTHWFLQGRAARAMVASTTIIMAVGFVLPYIPLFQAALRFVNPAATFVGFLAAELLLYCLEVQLVKVIYKRIFKTWL
ncbi:magnesium-transporting ATPase [Coccidioides immitis RMSCC 3703]|uniref:Magnesium-transporting ATPase n=1 Tax=Coccidioides immitis RMSCC 3703 TaxID=454286 RepID=A0A0J8QZR4_COCIT|nr:magnesium-transporting ATPase [Coccidioides immitis RMSCC 3703]